MPSPFPGMDPYLENPAWWPDVHHSLITYIRDALQTTLRPRYRVRVEERLYLLPSTHSIYPDVTIARWPRTVRETPTPTLTQTVSAPVVEPVVVTRLSDEVREGFIEIVQTESGEVVTVIEVLSPANKTLGEGRRQYLLKREEILGSRTNLVEIDLLSQGMRVLSDVYDWSQRLQGRYLICVSRATNRIQYEMYPINLPDRLPCFRIPLREPDPDVPLDLQAVFDRCYDNGAYADLVDYTKEPHAALSAEEQAWMKQLWH